MAGGPSNVWRSYGGEAGSSGRVWTPARAAVNRDVLAKLLVGEGAAATACSSALQDGAELILWEGAAPADRMLAAYRRRHQRALADAAPTVGFPEALERLGRAGADSLCLGQVSANNPDYVYMIFMTDNPPALVACVGIARPA